VRHRTKFRENRDMAIFSFFSKWRPSTISDLSCACLDHPRIAFGGIYQCTKCGWNRCSTFDNIGPQVLIFNEFGLKMFIHAAKVVFERGI